MLIRVLILMLTASSSCKPTTSNASLNRVAVSNATTPSYTLEIEGRIDTAAVLKVSVQVRKDGEQLHDANAAITLQLVCGTSSNTARQAVDATGMATFAALALASNWHGDCVATATTNIAGHALTQDATFTIHGDKTAASL